MTYLRINAIINAGKKSAAYGGVIQEVKMGGIDIKKLTEHVWLMDDDGSSGFVVTGEKKALVIDTMNGGGNVREAAESVTSLPLILVNTHVHPDHIGGNHFFKEAYMHPADIALVDVFTAPENKANAPVLLPVREGDVFDLGGLHAEVYELPGHTPGQICLLLREDRILFPGDSINHHLWMQLDGCLSLREYLKNLERLDFLKERADFILHGHSRCIEGIELFDRVEKGIRELVEQKDMEVTEKDEDYHWFDGVDKIHVYDSEGNAICYRKDNIF